MLTLYCKRGDPQCETVRDRLDDLSVAHRVVDVSEPKRHQDLGLPKGGRLPALSDSGQWFVGAEEIGTHLDEFQGFVAQWRKYQCDACYVDEEGNVE